MIPTPTKGSSFEFLAYILRAAALTVIDRVQRLHSARRNRRAIINLAEWDDRMLKDIGLSRSEVLGTLGVAYDDDPSRLLRRPQNA
jgi:uncharacterized protein YjiS (DUF1127 family)